MLKKFLIPTLLFFITGAAMSQTSRQEANLKAVFIYNFTHYIDWDTSRQENNFVIGIVGPSPITGSLMEIAKENTVNNKKIMVRPVNKLEDIYGCQLVFIPRKNAFSLYSILDRCGRGVLTVSEEEGFARQGVAFNFVIINDKLKFEANLKSLYLAGLKASSKLLRLAIITD